MLARIFSTAFILCLFAPLAPSHAAGWSAGNAPMYYAFNRGHTLTSVWRRLDSR